MKAIIMAGGKGTRLSPLTNHLPKPMVPLLDYPCMQYIIELLKQHGITDIGVTLQYLPNMIKNYFGDGAEFGVKLHYFEEITPLGTAGSVKNAEDFLDETFLVISGDAFTDFDLSKAIGFHQQKQALATLVLTRVEIPLEYGVVMTEEDGKIIRFLEKPSWSEVFSDTVNTGIYVLEPRILNLFRSGQKFDFSKDLFPMLLERKLPIYGHVAEGYWSDIGSLAQYRQTQFDMLGGKAKVKVKAKEHSTGVWVGNNILIPDSVRLTGPVFIGAGTEIGAESKVGPYVVLGRNNRLGREVSVEHSVLWNSCYVGNGAGFSGATLCSRVQVGESALIGENAVVGAKSSIEQLAILKPGVKIWPEKRVGANTTVQSSLIWGDSVSKSLFGSEGISGIPNVEITPEVVGRIISAYGSSIGMGETVSVSSDGDSYNSILKLSIIANLLATGISVRDIGDVLAPVARYECRNSASIGGIHLRKINNDEQVLIQFFDQEGLPIDKDKERKIENSCLLEDFPRPALENIGELTTFTQVSEGYIREILTRVNKQAVQKKQFKVVVRCENLRVIALMQRVLSALNCQAVVVMGNGENFAGNIPLNQGDFGMQLDPSAQEFQLFTEQGDRLSEDQLAILQTLVGLRDYATVAVPVTAPAIVEEIAHRLGVSTVRTKIRSRSLLEIGKRSSLQVFYDGFYTLACILEYLALHDTSLKNLIDSLPTVHTTTDVVACPPEAKGKVMRRLIQETKGREVELIDGVKVLSEDAWALILPDQEKDLFKLIIQGKSVSKAEELRKMYKHKLSYYQKA